MTSKVLVLMGGFSREREISLQSGESCYKALRRSGLYEVEKLDFSFDISWLLSEIKRRGDVTVFNATHGMFGEDGSLQHLLDSMGVLYTHSATGASHLAFHKHLAGAVLRSSGLPMVSHQVVLGRDVLASVRVCCRDVVLKPTSEGSSFDVHVLKGADSKHNFCERPPSSLESYPLWLIEDFAPGKELTVAVLDGKALTVTEIRYNSVLYDYEAKYSSEFLAEHICPAILPEGITQEVLRVSEEAYAVLGCRGLARVDLRFDEQKDKSGLVILEVNTQPGMTEVSLAPEQALACGISMESLVTRLVEGAGQ